MKALFNRWPGGHMRCLTLSYDDGVVQDRQLIDIMNRYGIRGTFHLNDFFGGPRHIDASEVASLYAGHEVSTHMTTHPFPTRQTAEGILAETLTNRRTLESLVGYPVRTMSYPYGDYDARVIGVLRNCGIVGSRTVHATHNFSLPADFLEWHPTCHHKEALPLVDRFLGISTEPHREGLLCFYVWGHSYEFRDNDNWNLIESFCQKMGRRDDVWYATNIEIVDYVDALRRVQSSADGAMLHNPSAISVWFTIRDGGRIAELKPGQTMKL